MFIFLCVKLRHIPVSVALVLLEFSAAHAACVPSGTPGDDMINCTGVVTTGVNADGGNDHVRIEAGANLTLDLADGLFAPAIDLGVGGDSVVQIEGQVKNLASKCDHQSDSGISPNVTSFLSSNTIGIRAGIYGDVMSARLSVVLGMNREIHTSTESRSEVNAAAYAPLFGTGDAYARAETWNYSRGIFATAEYFSLVNRGSIRAFSRPVQDPSNANFPSAEADAPSFGIEIGNAKSTASAESWATAEGVVVQPEWFDPGTGDPGTGDPGTGDPGTGAYTNSRSLVINEEGARIESDAVAIAEADGPAIAESLLNPIPDINSSTSTVHAKSIAESTAIEIRGGGAEIINHGHVLANARSRAEADALASSTSWGTLIPIPPWYCPWCPGLVETYATSVAEADANAYGFRTWYGGYGQGNIILNSETGVIQAIARAEAYADSTIIPVGIPVGLSSSESATATALAVGIDAGDGDNEITNRGVVSAEAKATNIATTAIGIRTGSGKDVIRNYGILGTIVNDVQDAGVAISSGGGDDEVSLFNGSRAGGRIDLGTGDDQFSLSGNAVVAGPVDAGQGSDGLILDGPGSFSSSLNHFETALKQGPGTFTLANLPSMQTLTVREGTLALNSAYAFMSGGLYQATLAGGDNTPRLQVNGNVTLAGSLDVLKNRGFFLDGSRYPVVTATGNMWLARSIACRCLHQACC